ncbi:hypothetical protein C0J52_20146 [Blattella germanica]|nr:hypothetical protein C0J52_20146 [Blattella germanica]
MKILIVLCLTLTLTIAQQQTNFGSGDISRFLRDNAFIQREIDCILDKGPCDEIGRNLKLALPEVVTRNCRSCNLQQATNARRLINYVRSYYPNVYDQIQARYG